MINSTQYIFKVILNAICPQDRGEVHIKFQFFDLLLIVFYPVRRIRFDLGSLFLLAEDLISPKETLRRTRQAAAKGQ